MTLRAIYLGSSETVYSFDGAKAWVSQQAGRRLVWVEAPDKKSWHGYRDEREAGAHDPDAPFGYVGRILTEAHEDF